MASSKVVLLGPQRLSPTLNQAVVSIGLEGRLGAVTAGWEEREGEDRELSDHLGSGIVNLRLHRRADELFARDPELYGALSERRKRMHELQGLYRRRLSLYLKAARDLLRRQGEPELLEPEREAAILAVRNLDEHHQARVRDLYAEYDQRLGLAERETVRAQRKELGHVLEGLSGLCIAGGHVGRLMRRLQLFDVLALLGDKPILAWSAGAMAISERIVLFHDSPPQGPGDAEVYSAGLGACSGVVALPHASRRLRLDDGARVGLFARRFAPATCVALDQDTRLDWDGERWSAQDGTRRLTEAGALEEVRAA